MPTVGDPLTVEERKKLIKHYMETPERRSLLASATLRPAQFLIERASVDVNDASLADIKRLVEDMERIQRALTGGEMFDRSQFEGSLKTLRILHDQIDRRLHPKVYRTAWERLEDDLV